MGGLRPIKEVYDWLRWDQAFDPRWISIGYEDRELGIREMPFTSFVPGGEVPWHRIQYFRCGDTRVWDRHTRTDLLASIRVAPRSRPSGSGEAPRGFRGKEELLAHLRADPAAPVWVLVRPAVDYPSFVEEVVAHGSPDGGRSRLDVAWRSYAMDWMGDATHVRVTYEFDWVDDLLAYVRKRYGRDLTDLTREPPPLPEGTPLVNGYPQPLVSVFQEAWRQLQADFSAGLLFDAGQRVVGTFGGF